MSWSSGGQRKSPKSAGGRAKVGGGGDERVRSTGHTRRHGCGGSYNGRRSGRQPATDSRPRDSIAHKDITE